MPTTAEQIEAVAAKLGLSMSAEFVPFSRSRNAKEKTPSLNWKVTILKWVPSNHVTPKQPILTTDYMADCTHCPSYDHKDKHARQKLIVAECETGGVGRFLNATDQVFTTRKPILPKLADVLSSLVMDASVINYGSFEEWASEAGYDADSRKAEATYRACLEIGLKLRNSIGEAGLQELREACQDY